MKSTYNQYLKLRREADNMANQLRNLGIEIGSAFVKYTYEEIPYIKEAIAKDDTWKVGLTLNKSVALCLACTEEDRNNHIDDSEIAFVNTFFDLKITRELVTEMHSKYI